MGRTKVRPCTLKHAPIAALGMLLTPVVFAASFRDFIAERFRGPNVQVREVAKIQEHVFEAKLHLNLKDFIELLLKNNTEINLVRLDVLNAADAVLGAKMPFDPNIQASFNSTRTVMPQFSQIGGAQNLNSLGETSTINYQQTLESGQILNFGFNGQRFSTNSEFNFLNPSISTFLNFQVTQPLWQGRRNLQLRAPLMIARTELLITSEQSEARIADLVAVAADQYWDAIQSRDNIKVQQQAYDLAQKQYERDKLALDLGALPSLDIFQSQSQVAQRKVAVIQAQYAYRDALDGLRRLIGADLDLGTRNIEIVLEDDPVATVAPVAPADEAISAALQKRPELSAVRRHQGINDLNARVARDSMLPRLDLSAIGGGNGLGGNQIPVTGPLGTGPTTFAAGGLGDALHQTFAFQAPFYGFQVNMTLPVRNSAATAGLADALVSRARDRYTERQLEQQVIQDVKLATSQIQLSAAQIDAAKTARDLAQKNVEAEQQKYELGGVTAFEVLDAQTRLATVESSLLQAYVGYRKALIGYGRAVWTLLDGLGIIVEMPNVR
jgi:outer membrane protein